MSKFIQLLVGHVKNNTKYKIILCNFFISLLFPKPEQKNAKPKKIRTKYDKYRMKYLIENDQGKMKRINEE